MILRAGARAFCFLQTLNIFVKDSMQSDVCPAFRYLLFNFLVQFLELCFPTVLCGILVRSQWLCANSLYLLQFTMPPFQKYVMFGKCLIYFYCDFFNLIQQTPLRLWYVTGRFIQCLQYILLILIVFLMEVRWVGLAGMSFLCSQICAMDRPIHWSRLEEFTVENGENRRICYV